MAQRRLTDGFRNRENDAEGRFQTLAENDIHTEEEEGYDEAEVEE